MLLLGLLLAGWVLFVGLGGGRLSWENVRETVDARQAEATANPLLWGGLYWLTYVAVAALSLPFGAVLTLLGGALFGRGAGFGLALSAATVGATLACSSARFLVRDWAEVRFGNRLTALQNGFARDGTYYLLSLRLAPVVPFFLTNLGMGLTRMPLRTFAWVSLLGMAPGTFAYVNAGTALGRLRSLRDVLTLELWAAFLFLALLPWLLRPFLPRSAPPDEPAPDRTP